VFNYGSPDSSSESEFIKANIYAIAFEPTSIPESIRKLSKRNIPHSPPIPYRGRRFDGYLGKLWTNVVLGGFLDGSSESFNVSGIFKGNLFFNTLIGNLIGRFVCKRWAKSLVLASFGERALYLTEYTHDISKTRSIGASNLLGIDGGLIGLVAVLEIIVGISDFDIKLALWQKLFSPVLPSEPGLWHLGDGPAIRLSSNSEDDIQTIVLKVKSLEDAKKRLAKYDLLRITADNRVSISAPRIQNLDIRLVE
jgi:hypothetical protein